MPTRLNQNRGNWGFVNLSNNNQNDIQKVANNGRRQHEALKSVYLQNGMSGTGMNIHGGDGIMDSIRGAISKGKNIAGKAGNISDILTGDTATALRNMLPSSDDTARPGYAGEKHAILKLANGKYGVANYMGPGTQLEKRLRRGDPPRTASDRVAQAHDSRYALAKSQKDVASADRKMIAKLKQLQKQRLDSSFNIQMGMRPIQAKLHAESLGLVKPGKIASFGDATDRGLVEGKLRELEQEGYGLPGDMLKMKLLRSMRKTKKTKRKGKSALKKHGKRGGGLGLPGGGLGLPGGGDMKTIAKHLAGCVSSKMLPMLLKKLGLSGGSLKLAGQGKKVEKLLNMKLLRAMNNGASASKSYGDMKKGYVMKGSGKKIEALKRGAVAVSKTLIPILLNLAIKKMGGSGKSMSYAELERQHNNPTLLQNLSRKLSMGAFHFLKKALLGKGMSGAGMCGKGFWSGFKKGFMSVITPTLKVAKAVAPLAPLLL